LVFSPFAGRILLIGLPAYALGGNALLQHGDKPDAGIQLEHVRQAAQALAPLAWRHEQTPGLRSPEPEGEEKPPSTGPRLVCTSPGQAAAAATDPLASSRRPPG
jgi:hypothetical protein